MRNLLYTVTLICLCFNLTSEAQTIINSNVTKGCDLLTTQFTYTTTLTPVTSVQWNFGRSINDTSSLSTPNLVVYQPGIYTVTLVLNGNDTTRIRVGTNFNYTTSFDYGFYTLLFQGRVALKTSSDTPRYVNPKYRYEWDIPGRYLENPDSSFLIHRFDSARVYTVRMHVYDSIGCIATVVRQVVIRDTLIVPNVFTPNEDPYNNELRIPTNGKNKFLFKVFSRTGLLIYTTESKILSWDGRLHSGEKALPGIYYYVIETLDLSPPMKQAGFFYIYQ